MACPQQFSNAVVFTIPGTSNAAVIVCFHGNKPKMVELNWGDGSDPVIWNSCEPGIVPNVNYSAHLQNLQPNPYEAVIKVYYEDMECMAELVPAQPAENAMQLLLNCNSFGFNPIVAGAWKFPTPGDDESVQVTIVVEDTIWGEG